MGAKLKKSTKKLLQKGLDGQLKQRRTGKAVAKIAAQKQERLQGLVERQDAQDLKKAAHDKV